MSTVMCTNCYLVMHIPCCEERKVIYSICQNCLMQISLSGEERCFQCGQHIYRNLMTIKSTIIHKNQIKNIENLPENYHLMIQGRYDGVNYESKKPMVNLNRCNSQNYIQNQVNSGQLIGMREIYIPKEENNFKGHFPQNSSIYPSNQNQELTEQDIRMSNQVLSMPLNCEPRLIKERQKIGKAEFSSLRNASPPPQFEDWQFSQGRQSYTSSIFDNETNH